MTRLDERTPGISGWRWGWGRRKRRFHRARRNSVLMSFTVDRRHKSEQPWEHSTFRKLCDASVFARPGSGPRLAAPLPPRSERGTEEVASRGRPFCESPPRTLGNYYWTFVGHEMLRCTRRTARTEQSPLPPSAPPGPLGRMEYRGSVRPAAVKLSV